MVVLRQLFLYILFLPDLSVLFFILLSELFSVELNGSPKHSDHPHSEEIVVDVILRRISVCSLLGRYVTFTLYLSLPLVRSS